MDTWTACVLGFFILLAAWRVECGLEKLASAILIATTPIEHDEERKP